MKAMASVEVGSRIADAIDRAQLSQRKLAELTGIPQARISRIVNGQVCAKVPELLEIADATGHSLDHLMGTAVADRVQVAARSTNGADMAKMKSELTYFMELNAYLDDQIVI